MHCCPAAGRRKLCYRAESHEHTCGHAVDGHVLVPRLIQDGPHILAHEVHTQHCNGPAGSWTTAGMLHGQGMQGMRQINTLSSLVQSTPNAALALLGQSQAEDQGVSTGPPSFVAYAALCSAPACCIPRASLPHNEAIRALTCSRPQPS